MQSPCNDDVVVKVNIEGNEDDGITDSFESRNNLSPTSNGSLSMILTKSQFHEEERNSSNCIHDQVWYEECASAILVTQVREPPDLKNIRPKYK